jgi:hypothetical protein
MQFIIVVQLEAIKAAVNALINWLTKILAVD